MPVTIWHNPRCSKSRQTLKLLEEQGVDPDIRLYLKDAPSADEIRAALKQLGQPVRALLRSKEPALRERFPDPDAASDEQLINALAEEPVLIERPLVLTEKGAALGRPPEQVLSVL